MTLGKQSEYSNEKEIKTCPLVKHPSGTHSHRGGLFAILACWNGNATTFFPFSIETAVLHPVKGPTAKVSMLFWSPPNLQISSILLAANVLMVTGVTSSYLATTVTCVTWLLTGSYAPEGSVHDPQLSPCCLTQPQALPLIRSFAADLPMSKYRCKRQTHTHILKNILLAQSTRECS